MTNDPLEDVPRQNSPGSPSALSTVGGFFDRLSDDYTAAIQRCFPRYSEMLGALLSYVPDTWRPTRVLELGCGTGNLSVMLAESFPQAQFCFVDLSSESLDVLRQRLGASVDYQLNVHDIRHLDFAAGSFDWITSSIAIHHLTSVEKRALFQRAQRWLRPGGIFSFADQFRGATAAVNSQHMAQWQLISKQAGATAEEWIMWMAHQDAHDHHDTLADQMLWLSEAGFRHVDCVWRYLLWTVVRADAVGGGTTS